MKKITTFIFLFICSIAYSQVTLDTISIVEQINSKNTDLEKTKEQVNVVFNSDNGTNHGYQYLSIRGIDQTRINYTMDDVPLNEQEDQGFYPSNFPVLTNNLKSMSITNGVGNSSFGTSGYGANVIYRTNQYKEQAELCFNIGSFKTLSFSQKFTKKINNTYLTINNAAYRTNGYRYNSGGSGFNNFVNITQVFNKSTVRFTSIFGKSMNQMAWLASSQNDINIDPKINYNMPNETDNFNQSINYIQYTRSNFKSTVYFNKLIGKWSLNLNPDILTFKLKSTWIGWNGAYTIPINNQFDLKVGSNLFYYNRKHSGVIDNNILYINNGIKVGVDGFTQLNYRPSEDLSFLIDVQYRINDYSYLGAFKTTINNRFVNPRFSVNYKNHYYLFVGNSKREPTRLDYTYANDDPVEFRYLKNEEVLDVEFGYKNSNFNINFFAMLFKNEISYQGIYVNGFPIMNNLEQSFRTGLELSYCKTIKKFSFNSNWSLCYSKAGKYTPLLSPRLILNNSVRYKSKKFYVELFSKYQSSSYISFNNKIPGFVYINSCLGYRKNKFDIELLVNNITNAQYYTKGYVIDNVNYLYTNAGTNFNIKLCYLLN